MTKKIIKRNKSFFPKAKDGKKFEDEKYEKYDKIYDFYCPKCRIKFNSNIYRYSVTIKSMLNLVTRHKCNTRCHRFINYNADKVEELFLKSNKTPQYFPEFKRIKDAYKERAYKRKTKGKKLKEEFEV